LDFLLLLRQIGLPEKTIAEIFKNRKCGEEGEKANHKIIGKPLPLSRNKPLFP